MSWYVLLIFAKGFEVRIGVDGRLRWLILGSIGVFRILYLRRLKGLGL